jgi:hypothetical protein
MRNEDRHWTRITVVNWHLIVLNALLGAAFVLWAWRGYPPPAIYLPLLWGESAGKPDEYDASDFRAKIPADLSQLPEEIGADKQAGLRRVR